MSGWLAAPVALPLGAAAVAMLARERPMVGRALGLAVPAAVLLVGVVLLVATADGSVVATAIAGWPAGVAIPFVADALTALLLTTTALLVLACTAFAALSGADRSPGFAPLVLTMSAGAFGAFLTGDLFNLFVLVEVMLVPSYVLLVLDRTPGSLRVAPVYVAVNLTASTLLLVGVGLVYAATGTVVLAELDGEGARSGPVGAAAGLVVVALAVKAAVVPVHWWLPRCYPEAPPVVTALFSGLLTKVGVLALYRIWSVVFDADPRWATAVGVVVGVTMVVGVLEAIGATSMRRILSAHMVSQVGYLLLGLAVTTAAGLAAAVFYLVQYLVVKTSLFLTAATVEHLRGSDRLDRLGGVFRTSPALGLAFLGAALSLAGLPPFSGFVGKLLLVRAAVLDGSYVLAGVAVAVSLGTLLSMLKIWNGVFWGDAPTGPGDRPGEVHAGEPTGATVLLSRQRALVVLPALGLAVLTVVLGLGAQPLLEVCQTAAAGLLDPAAYVEAVRGT